MPNKNNHDRPKCSCGFSVHKTTLLELYSISPLLFCDSFTSLTAYGCDRYHASHKGRLNSGLSISLWFPSEKWNYNLENPQIDLQVRKQAVNHSLLEGIGITKLVFPKSMKRKSPGMETKTTSNKHVARPPLQGIPFLAQRDHAPNSVEGKLADLKVANSLCEVAKACNELKLGLVMLPVGLQ